MLGKYTKDKKKGYFANGNIYVPCSVGQVHQRSFLSIENFIFSAELIPKGLNVRTADKPVLVCVT
jgi:hypothetical protein